MLKMQPLKSRLTAVRPRLARSEEPEQDRSRQRDATQPWRAWYKTARWQKLRLRVLKRDGYVCQATGILLVGKHPAPNSPVADHIVPHRGNIDMFFDEANVQAVSKEYHDKTKQSLEKRGLA